jgi:hypothetical protein
MKFGSVKYFTPTCSTGWALIGTALFVAAATAAVPESMQAARAGQCDTGQFEDRDSRSAGSAAGAGVGSSLCGGS